VDAEGRQDRGQQVVILTVLGDALLRQEDAQGARVKYEEGLRFAEAQRDLRAEATVRIRLARLLAAADQHAEGVAMAQRALALYQTLRDRSREADTLSLLGSFHQAQGDTVRAAELYERALALYRALRDQPREAASLVNLATVYEAQGSPQEARETQHKAIFLLQQAIR